MTCIQIPPFKKRPKFRLLVEWFPLYRFYHHKIALAEEVTKCYLLSHSQELKWRCFCVWPVSAIRSDHDINWCMQYFGTCLYDIVNFHAPIKTKTIRQSSVPYMNSELRKLNYQRNMVRNLKNKHPSKKPLWKVPHTKICLNVQKSLLYLKNW